MEDDSYHIQVPFSLDAPYLATGQMEDVPTQGIYLEYHDYDECYLAPQVSETPDAAVVSLIRSELATLFHEKTAEMIRSLCDSLAAREDDIRHGNLWGPTTKVGQRSGNQPKYRRWKWPGFAPCPIEEPLPYRQHGYQLGHLFRSLFLVVDDGHYRSHESPDHPEEDEEWLCADYSIKPAPEREPFQPGKFQQDEKHKDWQISRCPVLLVRTGDEGHLSAPISFHREDCGSWEDAVRVRLDHALEFIGELIGREKEALPDLYEAAEALNTELDELYEQWIERVLGHAAEVGFDNNGFTWQAIGRARARLNGEAFDIYQVALD